MGVAALSGVVSGIWNDFGLSWGYALFAVVAGGILSLLVALLRSNAVITDRRLALLRDLLGLADRPQEAGQLVDRILVLLVPAFADAPRSNPTTSAWGRAARALARPTGSPCR